uniref:Uncharacterized protein n=1 Tax=Anguilla anguilla TaxID=7936 RepID=A0A0E9PMJ5_ANGAN
MLMVTGGYTSRHPVGSTRVFNSLAEFQPGGAVSYVCVVYLSVHTVGMVMYSSAHK